MARYPVLPLHIRESLKAIQPSGDEKLAYFPCRATLSDGRVLDTVYIVAEEPYIKYWGIWPEQDNGKKWIRIEQVQRVEDSPTRLPARFANELYESGESGRGYTVFTVVFADGHEQACVTGNALDFISYPPGKGPLDVVDVIPHKGKRDASLVTSPEWYWCLHSTKAV
jgi:hypothetical protein